MHRKEVRKMPKNKPGYRWVRITDEQYQKCIEMSEPDTRAGRNQFEPISLVAGWCIDNMFNIPPSLQKKLKTDPQLYQRICDLLMKGDM